MLGSCHDVQIYQESEILYSSLPIAKWKTLYLKVRFHINQHIAAATGY